MEEDGRGEINKSAAHISGKAGKGRSHLQPEAMAQLFPKGEAGRETRVKKKARGASRSFGGLRKARNVDYRVPGVTTANPRWARRGDGSWMGRPGFRRRRDCLSIKRHRGLALVPADREGLEIKDGDKEMGEGGNR